MVGIVTASEVIILLESIGFARVSVSSLTGPGAMSAKSMECIASEPMQGIPLLNGAFMPPICTNVEPKKILYISGSLGLGHITRDLSIAHEIRRRVTGAEIEWLVGEPAKSALISSDEMLAPESAFFADDSAVAENIAAGMSLNVFKYIMQSRKTWKQNVQAFKQIVKRKSFDMIIADEAYEIDLAVSHDSHLRRCPFVMIYDFVGLDATSHSPLEKLGVYYWNYIWGRQPPVNFAIFIGELEDIPDRPFGFGLPNRRHYASQHYHPVGYVLQFHPDDYSDIARVRARLGYGDEPLVICSIGGTSIGKDLLELCSQAYPILKQNLPDLRMVMVCGPRLVPDSLQGIPAGIEIQGYVPALYEHLAACDLAIVQGGSTTTLELTVLRRPFVYFPVEGHFEQEEVVAKRLARQKAGIRMTYSKTTPQHLAEVALAIIGCKVEYPPIHADGASQAAGLICDLLA